MAAPAALDHIVVNARTDMDRCEALFADLGFSLTPRGHHTLGSINALAMFETDYLELLGLPPGKEELRPELASAPRGLNGVVFKTDDADATYAHLQSLGIEATPPKSFSRPVTLDDGTTQDAKFRTVTLAAEFFPAGRFYFCEHGTPDLVWRPEWQAHANGTKSFAELVVVSGQPEPLAKMVGAVLEAPAIFDAAAGTHRIALGPFTLSIQTREAYRHRFGAMAVDLEGRTEAIAAAILDAGMPDALVDDLRGRPDDYEVAELAGGLAIKVRIFDTLFVFERRAAG